MSGRSLTVDKPVLADKELKAKLVGFTQLSNLLCLGGKTSLTVAATGTLENDRVNVILVATNNHFINNLSMSRAIETVAEVEAPITTFTR
jgi:hypothetical protein